PGLYRLRRLPRRDPAVDGARPAGRGPDPRYAHGSFFPAPERQEDAGRGLLGHLLSRRASRDHRRGVPARPGLPRHLHHCPAGATIAAGRGYQIRWEIRDNIVGIQTVTGPAERGAVPPHETSYRHIFSLNVGLDVILEKRRGRRY